MTMNDSDNFISKVEPVWAYYSRDGVESGKVYTTDKDLVRDYYDAAHIHYDEAKGGMCGHRGTLGYQRLTTCNSESEGWANLARRILRDYDDVTVEDAQALRDWAGEIAKDMACNPSQALRDLQAEALRLAELLDAAAQSARDRAKSTTA